MMRYLVILLLLLSSLGVVMSSVAQDPPDPRPHVLVSGVDVNGQGFPLVMIDLDSGTSYTLATFANRPVCPPSTFPGGERILYQSIAGIQQAYAYQVEIATSERLLIPVGENPLTCPIIAPDGGSIAWLRTDLVSTEDERTMKQTTLVLTDPVLETSLDLVSHTAIYDVEWSPGGGALVYYVTDASMPFPQLYSLPREGGVLPRLAWALGQGILADYRWVSSDKGLLIAYYMENGLALALLPTACVIGPGDPCQSEPLAVFPSTSSIELWSAIDAEAEHTIVSIQDLVDEVPQTDLWMVDLTGAIDPQQLTFSPNLIENDARWMGDEVYFIGSYFDQPTQTFSSAIYVMPVDGTSEPQALFSSAVFSPSLFLWWYE
ncbi:MAG: hypothetical protein H6673_04095 [Anaerolineales bacterium]|nr:hypothetical protein [Anaerolineales bacterium]